jgi:hypothetical protein
MVFTFILRRIVGTEESSITLLVTKRQRIVRIRKWSINFIFDDIVIEERLNLTRRRLVGMEERSIPFH